MQAARHETLGARVPHSRIANIWRGTIEGGACDGANKWSRACFPC